MTYVRILWKKLGGHYHCRLFTSQGRDTTYAKCGDLVFDEREWPTILDALSKAQFVEDREAKK